jgi:hypothetical protein
MEVDYNKITEVDRICVNCRHLKRRWGFTGTMDWVASRTLNTSGEGHYRCTRGEPKIAFNTITGRKRVISTDFACVEVKNGMEGSCVWEPSERWKRDPKNLFKLLKE